MGLLLLMGNAGVSFTGALDSLGTGLESAWSVSRRLRAAYTGPIIRVRRSSDNAEQDFSGSDAAGAVSTSAVASFCGAGSGFLTTIYDQSGNGRHFVQATTTVQPIVCESGVAVTEGTRLAGKYVEADARRMAVATSTALYNFMHTTGGSLAVVSKSNDTAANKAIIRNNAGVAAAGFAFLSSTGEQVFMTAAQQDVAGVSTAGTTLTITTTDSSIANQNVAVLLYDPDNATANQRGRIWVNGTASANVNAATATPFVENASGNLTLGAGSGGGNGHDGTIQEVVIWSQLLSTASRDAYESNAGTFYGITVA